MISHTLFTFNQLQKIEGSIPEIRGMVRNGCFVFDETTTHLTGVYLGNTKEDKKEKEIELNEIVFQSPQPNLKYLEVTHCSIKKITISHCPNLQSLNLFGNGIEDIRFEGVFPKLQLIDLSSNKISSIELAQPNFPALKYLYLHNNNLVDLTGLAGFFMDEDFDFIIGKNETLTAPPKEILDEKQKVIDWFRQAVKYTTEKAYEAKILIVGEPGAGKTTLMELLFDIKYKVPQPEQPSTLGIEVKPDKVFPNPEKDLPALKAHIWDFGGHDIQYMLHQYFLTDDSVYIMITDGRKGETRYGYWFHIISLLGGNSPVLVLLNRNKKSDNVIPFDEKTYTENFPDLNIINCGEIDFANLNKTWDAFEEKIAHHLSKLPVVGQTVIKPWKKIRDKIDGLRKDKYILLDKFEKICEECGLSESKDVEFLLGYFHKIGVALNFDDVSLKDKVFLDPNWITHAIYDVLSDQMVIDKNGEFKRDHLYNHWRSKICTDKHKKPYKTAECGLLLSLMLKDKFDICYKLPHKHDVYVVPMKLPKGRPDYDLGAYDKLHFRFQYKFMPEGLISRLIVRLHEFIYDGKVWRTGAVFDDNDCLAEVIHQDTTSEGLKYIGIKVSGKVAEKRRALLHTIRQQVESIHKSTFPYISYDEMVVCNCPVCDESTTPNFYELDFIKSNLEVGERTVFCKKGKRRVEIRKLLHEVYTDAELPGGGKGSMESLSGGNKIFISYSSADRDLRQIFTQRIEVYLAGSKVNYDTVWSDVEIAVGGDWNLEI